MLDTLLMAESPAQAEVRWKRDVAGHGALDGRRPSPQKAEVEEIDREFAALLHEPNFPDPEIQAEELPD